MAEKDKRTIVKEQKGVYRLFSDGTILLRMARASHPYVGKGRTNVGDDGQERVSRQIVAMLPKETHGAAKDAMVKMMADLTKGKKGKNGNPLKVPASKKFLKNGDAVDEDGDRLYAEECEGHWLVSAREADMPMLRGPRTDPKTGKPERLTAEQADKMIYGGCYVDVMVRPWLQDSPKYGVRLNAGLTAVQFKKPGERFGGSRVSEDDIDDSFDADESDDGGWDADSDDNDDL